MHLSTVLFAVASADPQAISRKLRFSLKVSLGIGIPGVLVLCLGAHVILSLFGGNYPREATFPLWMLALSYTPGLPKIFYVAVCRAHGKVSRAAVVRPIHEFVKVDVFLPGCPPSADTFHTALTALVTGEPLDIPALTRFGA